MTPFRVLMMIATLLATATAVNAQEPRYFPPAEPSPLTKELQALEEAAQLTYEQTPVQTWHMRAWQETVSAYQRMRAFCSSGQAEAGCCEAAHAKAAACAMGVAGSVKTCETVQTPKSCACAKACACCESCKAKKDASAQTESQLVPLTPEMLNRMLGLRGITPQPFPVFGGVPPMQGAGIVQVVPVPPARVMHVVQVAFQVKPVHLVTPDLDAICERMHHHGDTVVLEGNVLLLCKKHAQPIRIEAQRVVVNMKDGSFTVESTSRTVTTSGLSIQGTSVVLPTPANGNVGFDLRAPTAAPSTWSGVDRTSLPTPAQTAPRTTSPEFGSDPRMPQPYPWSQFWHWPQR